MHKHGAVRGGYSKNDRVACVFGRQLSQLVSCRAGTTALLEFCVDVLLPIVNEFIRLVVFFCTFDLGQEGAGGAATSDATLNTSFGPSAIWNLTMVFSCAALLQGVL